MRTSFTSYDAKWAGKTIGLYGGSFNPAHQGHLHVSQLAFEWLELDALWWLVSPGNPLKDASKNASLEDRTAHARELVQDKRIHVTTAESDLQTRFSWETIEKLRHIHKDTCFIWCIGADNLENFHLWRKWEDIFRALPIAVFARPGYDDGVLTSPAATAYAEYRLEEADAKKLKDCETPAWVYLNTALHDASATALRQAAGGEFKKAAELAKTQDNLPHGQQRKDKE